MATGTGKTRTSVALVKLLGEENWIKRVLFLADRTALLTQASKAFRTHLPTHPQANLSKGDEASGARLVFSTYPTMANAVDRPAGENEDGRRAFTPGTFDLIVVDEAHRSVYNRWRVLFDYFDSLLLGLTATPRDEVDRDTYKLFGLSSGDPTFAYELEDAVSAGYLVPPRAVEVPLTFPTEGITYADLSPEEREEYETKLVDETTGELLDRVTSDSVNRWLFNDDTVDQALAVLMERGIKVDGGDRLGKTILFARNHKHALFIKERFDVCYPGLGGDFASVIDSHDAYAEDKLDRFRAPARQPTIALSVDMLDTGIDVREIVNLVFFKPVRSRVKFWQMIGRGTRLRPDLFGPGQDKTHFLVFDLGGNFAFFGEKPEGARQSQAKSLSERLFVERLNLALTLRNKKARTADETALLTATLDTLHASVSAMNPDSILVRPHRELRDTFAVRERWNRLSGKESNDLASRLALLPSEELHEPEPTRRFDLAILQAQNAAAKGNPVPEAVTDRLTQTADALLGRTSVRDIIEAEPTLKLMLDASTWASTTAPNFEAIRTDVRHLAPFVPPNALRDTYTNFADTLGEIREVESGLVSSLNLAAYRERVRRYVTANLQARSIQKLRRNEPLTRRDFAELERLLLSADPSGDREAFESAFSGQSLGRSSAVSSASTRKPPPPPSPTYWKARH